MDIPININNKTLTVVEKIDFDYEPDPKELGMAENILSAMMGKTIEDIFSGKIRLNYV
jgi:hypothetical protein